MNFNQLKERIKKLNSQKDEARRNYDQATDEVRKNYEVENRKIWGDYAQALVASSEDESLVKFLDDPAKYKRLCTKLLGDCNSPNKQLKTTLDLVDCVANDTDEGQELENTILSFVYGEPRFASQLSEKTKLRNLPLHC